MTTKPNDRHASVDPEIAVILAQSPLDLSTLNDESLPVHRTGLMSTPRPELSDRVERIDHQVPEKDGEPALAIRVHRPKEIDETRGCLYWIHGGGLVMGSYEMEDARFDRWCQLFGIVGVAIEYRLAPETPYPGPIEDCYRGLAWVHENAGELGIDPERIGIGGASAGGGLAASLALLARDRGKYDIAYQLLIYPMLDDRQCTPSSTWEVPVWPPSANHYGWTAYLGEAKGSPDVSPYASAARAENLANLPPALVTVGSVDGFVDEDIDFALRLNQAGVATELHVYPGGPHGFDSMAPNSFVSVRARRDMEEWLGHQVGADKPT
ncbi:alpha/beta hydrolase [Myxococcota bacterium]|nr:alpha/beta hydrolase [Myxococcota bacterium]